MEGQVKWFNRRRGFGYITGEDGNDYFVHFHAINMEGYKYLNDGQKVTFDPAEEEKGPCAENVNPA